MLLELLFIHHSCGGQLLASPGPDQGTNAIYATHPNGGGLRSRLEEEGYKVHEASYGSRIGQNTDIFDWLPKFRDHMDDILACDNQNMRYSDARRNKIVLIKSCFPNNAFKAAGIPPGNPSGPELTVWNAKAAYNTLLSVFLKHQEVLFVVLTAPPLAPKVIPPPLWRQLINKARGTDNDPAVSAELAREFNNWLAGEDGWLKNSSVSNVVVFDYYNILTQHGASNFSMYPTGGGFDSHPSRAGNQRVAQAFVPFLNRAVQRAGISLK